MADLNLDVWDEADYGLKDSRDLSFLVKTNKEQVKSLQFDFLTYKANENMPCFLYYKVGAFIWGGGLCRGL